MAARPRLIRSIPFWILIVGSLASVAAGAWLVVDKITLMNATLTDGTATGVEVYGGQSWVTLGAVLVGAGLVGLVAALFLGALRSFFSAATPVDAELVEADPAEAPVAAPVEAATPESLGYEPELGYTPAAAQEEASVSSR